MSREAPLPTWEVNGQPRVFDLRNENHRSFLSGGLPPPQLARDGMDVCVYCDQRVPVVMIATHVDGATPVRVPAAHPCKPKVVA